MNRFHVVAGTLAGEVPTAGVDTPLTAAAFVGCIGGAKAIKYEVDANFKVNR